MEIKPNLLPVLPAGDVRGPASKDAIARGTEPAGFTDGTPAALPATAPAAGDPGALRLAQDPWADTTTGTRLLMQAQSEVPAGLDQMSLPDAVRSAVDFVFADLS